MRNTLCVAALCLGSALSWAAPTYQLIDLTPAEAYGAKAMGINASGQVVMTADGGPSSLGNQVLLWTAGQLQRVWTLPPDGRPAATLPSLADSGDVLFVDFTPGAATKRLNVWLAASQTTVQPPFTAAAKDVASAMMGPDGRIVATVITGYTTKTVYPILLPPQTYTSPVTACLYTAPNGASATASSTCVKAGVTGLNGNGKFGTTYSGFLYTSPGLGTFGSTTVKNLGRINGGNGGATTALSSDGKATGWVSTKSSGNAAYGHAFLHNGSTLADLGTLGGASSTGNGVNKAGTVVGYGANAAGAFRAFVSTNGAAMRDLNELVDPAALKGITLVNALGINDAGWIVAEGLDSQSRSHAILLKPVP